MLPKRFFVRCYAPFPNLYKYIYIYKNISAYISVTSSCMWPLAFQNSVWIDSDKGVLNYTTTSMSGWVIAGGVGGIETVSDWDCFYQQEYTSHHIVIYKYVCTFVFRSLLNNLICTVKPIKTVLYTRIYLS